MEPPRKDSSRWDIIRGPRGFGKNSVGMVEEFFVFDQIAHVETTLSIQIEQVSRHGVTRWNRVFSGTVRLGGKEIPVVGIYRPGHTIDLGYIVDSTLKPRS